MDLKRDWILALSLVCVFSPICSAEARWVKDFTSTSIEVQDHPHRVITLAPSLGELTADLLGDSLEKIKAVSDSTNEPPALRSLPTIGPYHRVNLEKILSLRPDLVVATRDGNSQEQILYLREKKIPVLVLSTENFQQVQDSISILAQALGESEMGDVLLRRFRQGLDYFKKKSAQHSSLQVFMQINDEPIMSVGKKSFLHEALERVGAKNIYSNSESSYPRPSLEDILQKNPDVILILAMSQDLRPFEKMKKKWMQFQQLKAVRDRKVLILKSDELLRPTLRIFDGLTHLEKALYGDSSQAHQFKNQREERKNQTRSP